MKIKYLLILMFLLCFVSNSLGQNTENLLESESDNNKDISILNRDGIIKPSISRKKLEEGMLLIQINNTYLVKLENEIKYHLLSQTENISNIAIYQDDLAFFDENSIEYLNKGKVFSMVDSVNVIKIPNGQLIKNINKETVGATKDYCSNWDWAINYDDSAGDVDPSTTWPGYGVNVGCDSPYSGWAASEFSNTLPDNADVYALDVGFYGYGDDLGFVFYDYPDEEFIYHLLGEDVSTGWHMISDYGNYLDPDHCVDQWGNTVYAVSGIYAAGGVSVGCGEAEKFKVIFYYTIEVDPEITLTPSSYNFDDIEVGHCSSTYSFNLKNIGGGTATGSVDLTGSQSNHFEITSGGESFYLTENQSKTIKVRFCPQSTGTKTAILKADGNYPCNDDESTVSGTGINPDPILSVSSDYDFGEIQAGGDSGWQDAFTVTNTGGSVLTGSVYEDPESIHFEIHPDDESYGSLESNESETIRVKFTPQQVGQLETDIKFQSNGGNKTRTVSGTGGEVTIIVGELKITGDNPTQQSSSVWEFTNNVKIGYKNGDFLVNIPEGIATVNTSIETITISNDDDFGILGNSIWNFSGTSWDFDCNAGTAEISTTLGLGDAGSVDLSGAINFQQKSFNSPNSDFIGTYSILPTLHIIIGFNDNYFGCSSGMGQSIDLTPNSQNSIFIEVFNNYISFNYSMVSNAVEFDASVGNGVHLKYASGDGSEFYFAYGDAPLTGELHIRWNGLQEYLEFTEDNEACIAIPIPISLLREHLGDEEYERLLREGYIFEITDSKNGTRASVNVGIKINQNSHIKYTSPIAFDINAELLAGVSWFFAYLQLEIIQVHIDLNESEKKLELNIESGNELMINGYSLGEGLWLNRIIFGYEFNIQAELFWGNNDDYPYYYFYGYLEGNIFRYSFLPFFGIEVSFIGTYSDESINGNGTVYFLGMIPVYNASISIYENGISIDGDWLFFGKNKDADTLNVLWESDFTYKTTRCTFLDRIAPIEDYETLLLEKNSFVYYDTTNASFFSLNSKYDGVNLNWQPYFDDDDLKFDLIKIDGITLSMASGADMRLESVEDSSRYIEIRKNGDFKRSNVSDLLFSCVRTEYPETGREWKIISVKSITGKSLNENFIAKIKNISNPDSCYFSYILANPVGKFVTYDNDILIKNHSYSTNIYADGSVIERLKRDDEQQTINKVHWDIENTTTGFSFNYISGEWNAIYDTLIVNVKTSEPSDCWLYYGTAPESLIYTIQSGVSLSNDHKFKIYKDDIHSRWFYKLEASKEDGNTIYAGPLIVPPCGSPTADFSASPPEGVKPLEVVFTDLSEVGPSGAEITCWEWDFDNDGAIDSNIPNTTHTYPDSGHYTVSLKIIDTNSESDTKIKNNYIEVWEPPIANFSAEPPLEGEPPLEVQFNDDSIPGSGNIISWYWGFGDDSTSTEQDPTHEYTEEDHYDVTLYITDSNELVDSITVEDFIFVRYKPIAKFSAVDTIGVKPLIVNFTDESEPGEGGIPIVEWKWYFGDGDSLIVDYSTNPTYTYPDSGHYNVTLIVTDENGVSDALTRPNYIEVWEPTIAGFSYSPSPPNGPPGLIVHFYDNSQPGSGEIVFWHWKFGDGGENYGSNSSVNQNPEHPYHDPGIFSVTLIIEDSNGLIDSLVKDSIVHIYSGPIANFSAAPLKGPRPLTVDFTDESIPGSGEITYWKWDFNGDGTIDSYEQNPLPYTYHEAGIYTVSLSVKDEYQLADTLIRENYIEVWDSPQAHFSCIPDPPHGPPILTVEFNDESIPGSGNITDLKWDFDNDGNIDSHEQNPEFNYNVGTFSVKLVIEDSNGLIDSLVKENIVQVYSGPEAKFSASPQSGEPPLKVQFIDGSIPGSGDINYWEWDFGDGETSNEQNLPHIYEESGIYTVSLKVTDTNNESDTIIKEDHIVVAKNCFYPNPYNPESGIIGSFRYTPNSSGNYTITIYDVSNQIVIELDCGSQTTNEIFEFNWNGKNASEKDVANGTYFYIIKSNTSDSYMNKLSILK